MKIKENEKGDKYLDNAKKLKKTMKHEGDCDTNCGWCTFQMIEKGTRRLVNKRTSGDHPDYSIIKITPKTEGSPGDLRRLAIVEIPVKKTISSRWCEELSKE